jgi:hypothetical protein
MTAPLFKGVASEENHHWIYIRIVGFDSVGALVGFLKGRRKMFTRSPTELCMRTGQRRGPRTDTKHALDQ